MAKEEQFIAENAGIHYAMKMESLVPPLKDARKKRDDETFETA
jgi:hypothetical protein